MTTKTSDRNEVMSPKLRRWLRTLDDLLNEVEEWASKEAWPVSRKRKQLSETEYGAYATGVLDVKTPDGWLVVDPIAHSVVGAEGRVDLYSFPTLRRVVLIRRGNQWALKSDEGLVLRRKWNRKTFLELARDLTHP